MKRRYVVLDVFTREALAGNPLAVVLDGAGLDGAAMQRIAREFNLSETVFVAPPERSSHTAAVRIFTPGRELPFAGHPTVGTAVLLAEERFGGAVERQIDSVVVLEEAIGAIRAAVRLAPGEAAFAEFDVPKVAVDVARKLPSKGEIAGALGLDATEIGFENHVPCVFDAGVPFVFVPVAGLDAASRARLDRDVWASVVGADLDAGVYVYCRETVNHDATFHARMFDVAFGIGEDPATGSAAAAFSGVVVRFDAPTEGTHHERIEQGLEMGRPSLIDLTIEMRDGKLQRARIGGSAVRIAEGTLSVDPATAR